MEDDIEEGAVHVQLAVVVNEAQPLPERARLAMRAAERLLERRDAH